jgi:hypothetical protein
MREVDDEAEPVHLADDQAPHPGEAAVMGLLPAGAEQGLIVIGQLHEAQPERVQHLDEAEIVLDRQRVLETEEDRRATRRPRPVDIGGRAPEQDQIRMVAKAGVPVDEMLHGFAERLVIGHRGMDGREPARPHLLEHVSRPAAELQPVDQRHGLGGAQIASPAK